MKLLRSLKHLFWTLFQFKKFAKLMMTLCVASFNTPRNVHGKFGSRDFAAVRDNCVILQSKKQSKHRTCVAYPTGIDCR